MKARGHDNQELLLGEFFEYLHSQGFSVGVDDYLQLHTLLSRVGAKSPDELKTLLCPIFATNRIQQELFFKAFDSYFQLDAARPAPADEVAPGSSASGAPSRPPAPPRVKAWPYVLAALSLSLVVFGAFYVRGFLNEPVDIPDPVVSQPPQFLPPELPRAPVLESLPDSASSYALRWLALLLPLICTLLYELYRRRRRRLLSRGLNSDDTADPLRLAVEGRVWKIYESEKFYNVARLLRRRQVTEFGRLDVPATVGATVRAAGFFTPVYKASTKAPEYVALIDRASYTDHQARMFDVLCSTLRGTQVFLTRYFYDGDPRVCFRPPFFRERPFALLSEEERRKAETAIDLSELPGRHYGSRLLIFGSGEGFIDPLSGELEPWVAAFAAWEERALLTPTPTAGWGNAEEVLSQQFLVQPATLSGLQALVTALELKEGAHPRGWHEDGPLPPTSASQRSAVVEDLREYLGPGGFQWLCACAVYPQLQWDLTLYMGALIDSALLREGSLLRLIRLPWFRTGQIPSDLRERLVRDLTPGNFKVIRTGLVRLMEAEVLRAVKLDREPWSLKVVIPRGLFKSKPVSGLMKQPQGRVFRDSSLVNFLDSPPGLPDLLLPRFLRKLLYPHGNPALGMRGGARVLLTLLLMFGAWALASGVTEAFRIPLLTEYTDPSPFPTPTILVPSPTPALSFPTPSPSATPGVSCPAVTATCENLSSATNPIFTCRVSVANAPQESNLSYRWYVDGRADVGIYGQGTNELEVFVRGLPDGLRSLGGTVTVGGLPAGCPNTVRWTALKDDLPSSGISLSASPKTVNVCPNDSRLTNPPDSLATVSVTAAPRSLRPGLSVTEGTISLSSEGGGRYIFKWDLSRAPEGVHTVNGMVVSTTETVSASDTVTVTRNCVSAPEARVEITFEDENGQLLDLCQTRMQVRLAPISPAAALYRPSPVNFDPRTCRVGDTTAVFERAPLGEYRVEAQSPVPPRYYYKGQIRFDSEAGGSFRLRAIPSVTSRPGPRGNTNQGRSRGNNTADCGGGRTVTCSAPRCFCLDNVGCTGYDAQGQVVTDSPCPAGP